MDTPRGLMVPGIPAAEDLTLPAIADAIAGLASRARNGELTGPDMRGVTFTISNAGPLGAWRSPAVVPPSNVAIMGLPTVVRTPVAVMLPDGQEIVAIRPDRQPRGDLRPPRPRRFGHGCLPQGRQGVPGRQVPRRLSVMTALDHAPAAPRRERDVIEEFHRDVALGQALAGVARARVRNARRGLALTSLRFAPATGSDLPGVVWQPGRRVPHAASAVVPVAVRGDRIGTLSGTPGGPPVVQRQPNTRCSRGSRSRWRSPSASLAPVGANATASRTRCMTTLRRCCSSHGCCSRGGPTNGPSARPSCWRAASGRYGTSSRR